MNIKIIGSTAYVDEDPVLYQYMQREHFKVKEGVYVSDEMWKEFVETYQDSFADYASQIAHSMWKSFSENFEPTKNKDFKKAWKEVLKERIENELER